MKTLTIIDLYEWAILFDGDTIVNQDHEITLFDIISRAKGEPVVLRHVDANGSPFDEEVSDAGDVPMDLKLSDALVKCSRSRKTGFAA